CLRRSRFGISVLFPGRNPRRAVRTRGYPGPDCPCPAPHHAREAPMERDVFQIELWREPSAILLRLAGDLDLAAKEPLRRLLDLLALQGTQSVLIDASDAEFIDASVVGTLF